MLNKSLDSIVAEELSLDALGANGAESSLVEGVIVEVEEIRKRSDEVG